MSRWTCCLAFLKVFLGGWSLCTSLCRGALLCVCEWGRSANATHQCLRRPKWGVCLLLAFQRARSLSVADQSGGCVCVDRSAERECSRQLLFFLLLLRVEGEGGEGEKGVGAHDILAKKKRRLQILVHVLVFLNAGFFSS